MMLLLRHRRRPLVLLLLVALVLLVEAAAFVVAFSPRCTGSRLQCCRQLQQWQKPRSQSQSPSHQSRPGRRRLTPRCAIQVALVTSVQEAEAITDFFVANFWEAPIAKPKQRQQLTKEVYEDLTTRYIGKAKTAGGGSKSSSKSALLVAKEGGKVVGCVGLETRVIREGQVTKQGSLKGEVPGASVQPVIANLAVDRSIRRRGIGKRILRECERVVKGWGFNELWLVVDEKNKPARTLYEKAGFELMGRDPRGRKVVPTEWQLREEACTNLCMRKSVAAGPESGGLGAFLSRLFGGR